MDLKALDLKFLLRDRNPAMAEAWRSAFRGEDNFDISAGDIFDVRADAIVSPANSFGFMDGGIDAVYSLRWPHLQARLQEKLLGEYGGELLVGQAVIIPTDDPDIPWLVSAPTMRVPMDIRGTVNAYLAFRAVLLAVARSLGFGSNIRSVLCPGLGTAIGKLEPDVAAAQMHAAYLAVSGRAPQPCKWPDLGEAWGQHQKLRRGLGIQ